MGTASAVIIAEGWLCERMLVAILSIRTVAHHFTPGGCRRTSDIRHTVSLRMKLRHAPIAIALAAAVTVGACGDEPTGNNNLDPTLAINPCDSAQTSAVGSNGFLMAGSGYQGQLVRLDADADIEFRYHGGGDDASIIYSMKDTVALPDDPAAVVVLDIHVPSSIAGTYSFNDQVGDSASYVRLQLIRSNLQPRSRVYRSTAGRIVLDTLVAGAQPFGRFCGTLRDSLSRAELAVMSGKFGWHD